MTAEELHKWRAEKRSPLDRRSSRPSTRPRQSRSNADPAASAPIQRQTPTQRPAHRRPLSVRWPSAIASHAESGLSTRETCPAESKPGRGCKAELTSRSSNHSHVYAIKRIRSFGSEVTSKPSVPARDPITALPTWLSSPPLQNGIDRLVHSDRIRHGDLLSHWGSHLGSADPHRRVKFLWSGRHLLARERCEVHQDVGPLVAVEHHVMSPG